VFKDAMLLMNASEELPFTMSPIRLLLPSVVTYKLVSWMRLESVVGSGP
jgi:hypothetical protein